MWGTLVGGKDGNVFHAPMAGHTQECELRVMSGLQQRVLTRSLWQQVDSALERERGQRHGNQVRGLCGRSSEGG